MSGLSRSFSMPDWVTCSFATHPEFLGPSFPTPLSPKALDYAVTQAIEENLPKLSPTIRRILLLVEDASRITKTAAVLSILQRELLRRVPDSVEIKLLIAGGAHLRLDNHTKYPPEMAGQIKVHNAYETIFAGNVLGSSLFIDSEVVSTDLRIAVGTVNLHPKAGFSGGSKILLPGAAGLATIKDFHRMNNGGLGVFDTPLRRMADQVLELFPIPFALQLLSNAEGEIWGLTSGELRSAWLQAATRLLPHVQQTIPFQRPFCLADASPFDQNLIGLFKSIETMHIVLSPEGEGVLFIPAPEGLGHHAWRLDSSVMRCERDAWETRLGCQKIWVFSPSKLSTGTTKKLFPPQIQLIHPSSDLLPSLVDIPLGIQNTPLIRVEISS